MGHPEATTESKVRAWRAKDVEQMRCSACGAWFADRAQPFERIVVHVVVCGREVTRTEQTELLCSACGG